MKEEEKISFFSALWRVFFVSALFWGAFFSAWGLQKIQQTRREKDNHFTLQKIAARSKTVDRVPLTLICSLLEIKKGLPLFALNPEDLLARFEKCPAFSYARVWRLLPGTLGVEYRLRTPIACFGELRNVAFDGTGKLFFILPFFAPKKLPSVVLDLPKVSSLEKLQEATDLLPDMHLAIRMLPVLSALAQEYKLSLEGIDLSRRNHPNIFRREIIITFAPQLSKGGEYLYLRSGAKSLSLKRVRKVFAYIYASGFHPGIVDMRFPGSALWDWKKITKESCYYDRGSRR